MSSRVIIASLASLLVACGDETATPTAGADARRYTLALIGDRCSAVLPSGLSGSGALVVDLAETAVGWMAGANRPSAALRALTSGYQALRRLLPEEKDAFFAALRFAAARDGARRLATGRSGPLDALRAVESVGELEARAAAG